MESPCECPPQDDGLITALSWNDKVPHILSVATTMGFVYIWEMRKNELFLTIADQIIIDDEERRNAINTNLIWSSDGVNIIIAYDHPDFPFLTQYHMKQPNAPSAEFHKGHVKPIIEITKNKNDKNFFLSLGKDNIVTCWSMRTV
jgi:protein transport protein SEC31